MKHYSSIKLRREAGGFTLLELMITLAVLAVLSAIALPAYNGYIQQGRIAECNNEIAAIMLAESQFFLENNSYFGSTTGVSNVNATGSLDEQSAGFYRSSTAANDTTNRNCTYTVVAGPTGSLASSFTVQATGVNKLTSLGSNFITKSGP